MIGFKSLNQVHIKHYFITFQQTLLSNLTTLFCRYFDMAETPPPPVSPLARALIPISQCSPGDPNKSIKTPEVCSLDVSKTSFTTPRRQFFLSKRKLEPPSSSSSTQPRPRKLSTGRVRHHSQKNPKLGGVYCFLKVAVTFKSNLWCSQREERKGCSHLQELTLP